jgi:pimeloyl-ACP methyl ester carboxylesterase
MTTATTSTTTTSTTTTSTMARRVLPWVAGSVDVAHPDGWRQKIAYDVVGDGPRTVLLVMGLSTQCIFWPDEFVGAFVDAGFRVVRFDNRDIGLSGSADRGVPTPITRDFITSRFGVIRRANYTLFDMVFDVVGLLDHLAVGAVDVVGISLGGIIAQMLAARHPDRVTSLGLIMSHTNHRIWGAPHPRVLLQMGPPPPGASRAEVIERNVKVFQLLGSPAHRRSDDDLRFAFATAYDRDHRVNGMERQTHALFATPCIDPLLADIQAPTAVLHGLADLLVVPQNSRRIAARIRHATLTEFPGMGHDFPPALLGPWAALLLANTQRAAHSASAHAPAHAPSR